VTNIVLNGRGTVSTTQTPAEVLAAIAVGEWVQIQPSGTLINPAFIVSISDTE
jgi:hypothetical protein